MPPAKEAATRDATAHGVGSRPVVDAREDAREDGMLHRKVELGRNGEKVRGSATAISVHSRGPTHTAEARTTLLWHEHPPERKMLSTRATWLWQSEPSSMQWM